jgi:UDP-N-acetylglucosamine--N-acetylmuramyl-(pentapeptide) pyrophosphoryl-undecaprenol N-acetylglucosamine transferase
MGTISKNNIVFVGGGSGGHVMPAITLIKKLKEDDSFLISYIGGRSGIERELISKLSIPYFPIYTGKLRRYLSLENLIDIFKVIIGIFQSIWILAKYPRKTLVFSTGGFVSVPVVIAAKLTFKTVYIHEQTSRVGLANKIASIFADKIFISFEESRKFFPEGKTILTGYPLRDECFIPTYPNLDFSGTPINSISKPIMFVTGGGNGSYLINQLVKNNLEVLKNKYFIIHQVGKSYEEEFKLYHDENYFSAAFFDKEIIPLFKKAKIVISRAGAGTVCELMALRKKSIFVPLKIAQKNEQFHNAMEAQRKLGSFILSEDEIANCDFISYLGAFEDTLHEKIFNYKLLNGTEELIKQLQTFFLR